MDGERPPIIRRDLRGALRDAVRAWSPRAYEARLVFTAIVAGLLAKWLGLSGLWAIISAVLVLQPDPVATRLNSLTRFAATMIGAVASVGAVAIGLQGIPAFLLALVVTCTVCAALALEEGLRPGVVCTAVLLIRPDGPVTQAAELHFAVDRILAVIGGGIVALAVAYLPGCRADAADSARGGRAQGPD